MIRISINLNQEAEYKPELRLEYNSQNQDISEQALSLFESLANAVSDIE